MPIPDNISIFYITVDSLQPDVLGTYGNEPSPTPFIDDLFNQGFRLNQCFSVGYPTEFAIPGQLTSSLPLDYGGTSYGISNRPVTLSEIFKKKGYATGGFVTGGIGRRMWGMDRGYDKFIPLFPLEHWLRLKGTHISKAAQRIDSGEVTKETVINILSPYIEGYLEDFKNYCENTQEINSGICESYSTPLIHDVNFNYLSDLIELELEEYKKDPRQYTSRIIDNHPDTPFVKHKDLELGRSPPTSVSFQSRLVLKTSILASLFYPTKINDGFKSRVRQALSVPRKPFLGRWTSAGYTTKVVSEWLGNTHEPVFAWTHLHDLHKDNLFSWELDDNRLHSNELAEHRRYLGKIRSGSSPFEKEISYPLSARYVDAVLERFVEQLHTELSEPPLIVITADHGKTILRDRPGHRVNHFYDETLRIPVAFVHPSIESESYTGLCSSMDIPATLLDILGYDIPESFRGNSVRELPPSGREYIVAEDMGRGLCDPRLNKPAIVCVRSRDKKVIGSGYLDDPNRMEIKSAYDLDFDPEEKGPIAEENMPEEFNLLVSKAQNRLTEARESFRTEGAILKNE